MIRMAVSEKLKTKITVYVLYVSFTMPCVWCWIPKLEEWRIRCFLGLRQYLQEKWPFLLSVKLSQPGFILFVSSYFVCIEEKIETKSGKD